MNHTAIVKCPDCGWYISDKSLFCVRCGCCFVDFEGLVKSLLVNLSNKIKVPEIKEEIKAPIPEKTEIKKKEVNTTVKVEPKQITPEDIDNEKVIYTVEEVKEILGIGLVQTYALVKTGAFPVKHIGKRMVIPIKPFKEWLNKQNGT